MVDICTNDRAAAGRIAGTQIGIKAGLPTVPAVSVSLFFLPLRELSTKKEEKADFAVDKATKLYILLNLNSQVHLFNISYDKGEVCI